MTFEEFKDQIRYRKTPAQKVACLVLSGLLATTFAAGTQIKDNIASYDKTAIATLVEKVRNKNFEENNEIAKQNDLIICFKINHKKAFNQN